MKVNDSRLRTDASRYVALGMIAFTLICATIIGTMAATHVISKAFAEIQASAGLGPAYLSRKEAALLPIPTPQMPGLAAPPSVLTVLSTQHSRMLEQVRLASLEPAPKRIPTKSAKLVSVPIKGPAQVAAAPYARVAVQ